MIVIINGPCGIGKTSVAWELNARFERAVMLDGDYIGAVHPFEIYDDQRIAYLYRTIHHLVAYHIEQGGYASFVINYVFESPESLAELRHLLSDLDDEIYAFRLVASGEAIPGLDAKPIIDTLVVVRHLDDAVHCIEPLQALGYTFIDYAQNTDRRFFRKGIPRTHHLHIVADGGRALADPVDFRDALRAGLALRQQYQELKHTLSVEYEHDRAKYSESKGAFVKDVLAEWRSRQ